MNLRCISLFLAIALILCSFILPASAADYNYYDTNGDWKYWVSYDGTYCITEYLGKETNVSIPSSIGGHTVSELWSGIFKSGANVVSVTVPSTVRNINRTAFYYCSSIAEVNVSAGNTMYAAEDGVLFNRQKTELIFYPVGKSDATYTVPSGVKAIGEYAFCDAKVSCVILPESLREIGDSAFSDCKSLQSLEIPANVTAIGENVFRMCTSLTSFAVDTANTSCRSEDGVIFSHDKTSLCYYPLGSASTSYTVPDGVKYVCQHSFENAVNLKEVTFPSTTVTVADNAFGYCLNLESVKFANGLELIGSKAFYDCSHLTAIDLPSTVKQIGDFAFEYCTRATSLTLSESLEVIGESAFNSCRALTSVSIPKNVSAIGNSAFKYCENVESFSVSPENGHYCSIDGALYTKSADELIVYPSASSASEFVLPKNVKVVAENAAYFPTFSSLTLPEGLRTINAFSFSGCRNLKTLRIPNSVTYISEYGFSATDLQKISCFYNSAAHKYTIAKEIEVELLSTDVAGDANGDGKFDLTDALTALKIVAAWDIGYSPNDGDVTGDGQIAVADAILMLKKIAGWEVEFK